MNRPSLAALQNGALVMLSVASLYLMTEVAALSTALEGRPSTNQLETLQLQLDRLDSDVNDPKQPGFVTLEDFEFNQQTITERLDSLAPVHAESIEHLQDELAALSEDVTSAKTQLLRLETMIENLTVAAPKRVESRLTKPVAALPARKPASLPFNILGVDLRGGEIFLAVAAFDLSDLADVVLMRPSASFMGWRLNSLRPDEAHFIRPDDSSHFVTIR
ncbi:MULTISPECIES: hypothetical protein [Pseudomonas]|uniref:hypothetical protein n=1 Tax=Pseudomonas TaxID=286 RepID=UPI00398FF3A0